MIKELNKTEQGVQQLIGNFTQAWNVHDAKAFSLLFAEDADFTNVFGQKAQGRTAIEKIHAFIFSTMFKESNLVSKDVTVRCIGYDLAAVDVIWNMTGATDQQGSLARKKRPDEPYHEKRKSK